VWDLLAKVINVGGRVVNSDIAGRLGIGAVFGAILGAFPIALVVYHGEQLYLAGLIGACFGAVVGFFYHQGYRDAERKWREQQRLDLEWRIKLVDERQHRQGD